MVVAGMIEGFRSPIPLRLGMAKAALVRRAAERVIVAILRTNSLPSFLRRRCRPRLRLSCGGLLGLAAHLDESPRRRCLCRCLPRHWGGARRAADHLGS